MPRFYFDAEDPGGVTEDLTGAEFPDAEAALDEPTRQRASFPAEPEVQRAPPGQGDRGQG